MSKSVAVSLSEAAIKRHAGDSAITQLRDTQRPLRFRYRQNRERGSFYVVTRAQGKEHWHKLGNYPDLTVKAVLSVLPSVMQRLAIEPQSGALSTSGWSTVSEVLEWYTHRVAHDANLSKNRKATARSAVKCQLLPCLGALRLVELNHATLDTKLMWPLQSQYSVAHVRLVFGVLKVAFKQAANLGLIGKNPMADMTFTDFIKTKIKPKDARLRPVDCGRLLEHWAARYRHETTAVALAVLMLAHGTRIGETRQAKWRHFDLIGKTWHIPAVDTKTKKAHTLPLTAQVCAFLARYRASQVARGYDGAYLFPGVQGRPFSEMQAQLAFTALSGEQWTSHDLRKTARTAWADLGVDYLIGELLLNHALKALDVTYIHTTAEAQKRQALERWHAWLDERGFASLHSAKGATDART